MLYVYGIGIKFRLVVDFVEIRGVILYYFDGEECLDGKVLVVFFLDDGSVCFWYVSGGFVMKRGVIVVCSWLGILFVGFKIRFN